MCHNFVCMRACEIMHVTVRRREELVGRCLWIASLPHGREWRLQLKEERAVERMVWTCVGGPSTRFLLLFFFKRTFVLSKPLCGVSTESETFSSCLSLSAHHIGS